MLQMLILLAFAKLQDIVYAENSRAWQWALAYGIVVFLFGIFSSSLVGALFGGVILGLYSWGYFALLRQVVDVWYCG